MHEGNRYRRTNSAHGRGLRSRTGERMAVDRLDGSWKAGRKNAGTYLQGNDFEQQERHGKVLVPSDPQLLRQSGGREDGDEQQRLQDPRRRRRALVDGRGQDACGQGTRPEPLPSQTVEARRDPEEEREDEAVGHTDDARQGDADALPAGTRPHLRSHVGPELLRIPQGKMLSGRDRGPVQTAGPEQPQGHP